MTQPMRSDEKQADDTSRCEPTSDVRPVTSDSTVSAPVPDAPRDDMPTLPQPFGRYGILREIGGGGMGTVYLAHDTQLDRLVALKVPRLDGPDRGMLRERFHREARAAALLHHPNICSVYDVGVIDDIPYLTMAYIEGEPLHVWAAVRPPRPVAQVLPLVRTLALALHEAHQRGVVHCDLKPSNILIDRRGEPVVMDFGLARRVQLGEERLTQPGVPMGTPAYMPPEQVLGQLDDMGPASDVYSLGVILYELLAGAPPFQGVPAAILAQILHEAPKPPSHRCPDLDPRLDALCLRALARQPGDRFPDMISFADAVTACLQPATVRPGRATTAVGTEPVPPSDEVVPPDPQLAPRILQLLRTWGWAQGVHKIRIKAQKAHDPQQRAAWQGFLDWMSGERTSSARAVAAFQALPEGAALRGWALAGRASWLHRQRDYQGSHKFLERAAEQGDPNDVILQATIAHTRGATLLHEGQFDAALPELHQALALLGRDHFLSGRVLDTLGMVYAGKGYFAVARQFYDESIRHKQRSGDEAGLAVGHGQLGRLHLDWGHLDEAEYHFQEDLRIAQKILSRWSQAQVYNHLGQVALARGEREAATGKRTAARRHLVEAAGWLDESIRRCQEGGWGVSEAFAHKDRALVFLQEGDLGSAEQQVRLALELFEQAKFSEGVAQAQRVEGLILRARGRCDEAERRLRAALGWFDSTQERDEAARTSWEIARTVRAGGSPPPLVTRAYQEALRRAEGSRLAPLVQAVEEELREVDFETYLRHVYRRARGHGIEDDVPSLLMGSNEVVTVLLLDLPGFDDLAQGMDAEAALVTFNQLMADCTEVLTRHGAQVLAYRGGGLMALVRESRHAERAVEAGLDLVAAVKEFNRPRAVLDLALIHGRIAVQTGEVLLGNVGTYHKMDFTALGAPVRLARGLLHEARPDLPCISAATREQLRGRAVHLEGPRLVTVPGMGEHEVWDARRESGDSPIQQRAP
jgi:class 3 adenylate cyclase/tetratricopeptide (TPR) repeat protein/predicted Ser/Thr protein kinase